MFPSVYYNTNTVEIHTAGGKGGKHRMKSSAGLLRGLAWFVLVAVLCGCGIANSESEAQLKRQEEERQKLEQEIRECLVGSWIIDSEAGQLYPTDYRLTFTQDGRVYVETSGYDVRGGYEIRVEEKQIVATMSGPGGTYSSTLTYEYEDGVLSLWDHSTRLEKTATRSDVIMRKTDREDDPKVK